VDGRRGGGIARRLTAGLSEPSTPCLSPDGRWLAFVGRDEHHPEVHVMPAEGGQARRLTWLGTDTHVRGWTPAGEIAYVTTQGQPFFRNHQGFALAPSGGPPRALGLGQVNHIAFGAGGRVAIGRNTDDPARWKRYRGGRAGAIWVDAEGSGTFRRLDQLAGNVTTPMWVGDRLYFIGDGEGVGNLYSCRADGADVRRHTDHGRLLRAPGAERRPPHRLHVRRAPLAVRSGAGREPRADDRDAGAPNAGGASLRREQRSPRVVQAPPRGPLDRDRRARPAVRDCPSGKARRRVASTTRARRAAMGPLPAPTALPAPMARTARPGACAAASGWPTARR
jgi:hypothetical protein